MEYGRGDSTWVILHLPGDPRNRRVGRRTAVPYANQSPARTRWRARGPHRLFLSVLNLVVGWEDSCRCGGSTVWQQTEPLAEVFSDRSIPGGDAGVRSSISAS